MFYSGVHIVFTYKSSAQLARIFHWVGGRSFIVFFVHVVFLGKLSDSDFVQGISQVIPVEVSN